MRKYYIEISVIINLFLMGERLVNKRVYVPIPPIEKGVNEAVEILTEEVYSAINQSIADNCVPEVEDLRLELWMECPPPNTVHYEIQLVEKGEVYLPEYPITLDKIRFCMVAVERELTKILAGVSRHLYD